MKLGLEANGWMAAKGYSTHWDWDHEISPAALRPLIEWRELVLARLDGDFVGTMALRLVERSEEETLWSGIRQPGEAAYLHRVAVRRVAAGGRLSTAMVGWAKEQARQAGRAYARLDCGSHRLGVRRFYESCGFACVGVVDGFRCALYEARLGPASTPERHRGRSEGSGE